GGAQLDWIAIRSHIQLAGAGQMARPRYWGAEWARSVCSLAFRGGGSMSRLTVFNSPLLLGFDHFERVLDRVTKAQSDGYPPYNVEQTGEQSLRLTLAVAGFSLEDLSLTVEDNQLVVRGRQKEEGERVYLHRGIAARQFQRAFVLAEGIEVRSAWLDN